MGSAQQTCAVKSLTAVIGTVLVAATLSAQAMAADGPALPPAPYKPLPEGTVIKYTDRTYEVARTEGFETTISVRSGDQSPWLYTHALFGEYADNMFATHGRGQVEYDIKDDNRKKLEQFWPLTVGKKVEFEIQEEVRAAYGFVDQWRFTLTVVGTENLKLGGHVYPTYVIDEKSEAGMGSAFTSRKWYHPPSGLVIKSSRTWTKIVGGNRRMRFLEGGRDGYTLVQATFPKGTPDLVVAAGPPPIAATGAPAPVAKQPAPAAAPPTTQAATGKQPSAAFKPLPVGTRIEYDSAAFIVASTEGYGAVLKKTAGDGPAWLQTYGLFGEYGTNIFVRHSRGEPIDYDIDGGAKKRLEAFWPLAVGKETTFEVSESAAMTTSGQTWNMTYKVAGEETVDIGGRNFRTLVIEEKAQSSLGMAFVGRKWYDPATGVVVRWTRQGTGENENGMFYTKRAVLAKDDTQTLTLRQVTFPAGTTPALVAAAQGTPAAGKAASAEVEVLKRRIEEERKAAEAEQARHAEEKKAGAAELARLSQEVETRRKTQMGMQQSEREARELREKEAEVARLKREAEERQRAEEARQAEVAKLKREADEVRQAEIAKLKQEAEQMLKVREVEMAKRLAQAEEARKTREAEVTKLKQESELALKSREAEIARLKQTLAERNVAKPADAGDANSAYSGIDFGRYHALIIGIDNYKRLPILKTAVNDARAIAGLLEKEYGFKVKLLVDPTRNDIVDIFDVYRETLGPNDNLLIYYAGHGWLDKEVDRGYWLPIDADPKRRRDWISNATITDTLKALGAKHVMVIADSCYSGTLVRGSEMGIRARTGDYWKQMARKWARVAITSGGLEPVSDAGSGGHSPFAKAFLDALDGNRTVMDGTTLFSEMRRPIMVSARQTPQYADVREAGHDGGDFLFVRKK